MNRDKISQREGDALLQTEKRRERWLRDADRFHTKTLFGLWLALVLACFVVILVISVREDGPVLISVALFLLASVLFTGAYVYQEVRRLHGRIDAMRKLEQEEHRTSRST